MATWEPDEIDFEDQYDKADPIDDADLDASMTLLNELIRQQEELEKRIRRYEWTLMNQSSDILQHSQNRPTGDRWLKF